MSYPVIRVSSVSGSSNYFHAHKVCCCWSLKIGTPNTTNQTTCFYFYFFAVDSHLFIYVCIYMVPRFYSSFISAKIQEALFGFCGINLPFYSPLWRGLSAVAVFYHLSSSFIWQIYVCMHIYVNCEAHHIHLLKHGSGLARRALYYANVYYLHTNNIDWTMNEWTKTSSRLDHQHSTSQIPVFSSAASFPIPAHHYLCLCLLPQAISIRHFETILL